ncbi:MAG: peptidylprolyl isomerase, partial [Bacteroidales bacterium]|nr:peptidylprolyl isomerase [Bacteroidales bacterium]
MIRKKTLKTWLVALSLAMVPSLLSAQSYTKKTLITIGDKEVSVKEFMDTYEKNNVNTEVIDKKNVDEYLDLFVDFKLKVAEAENLKMDTSAAFIKELDNYRQQLAKPYFSNDDITDELVKEAYERMQYDINAAHILIKCDVNAVPSDTMAAYKKAMSIRERTLKGEAFGDLAAELSEDPSARDYEEIPGVRKAYKGNRGELGYFTVFDMVYPFESGVYNTEVGGISMPVRSSFGYHIIKLNSKTPASGLIRAAHIFLAVDPKDPDKNDSLVKIKAQNIYNEVINDDKNWTDYVRRYSDDKGTINNNGVLSPFRVNQIVPEFISVVKSLEPNQISEPVKTDFGYHIIKLVGSTTPGTFEQEEGKIRERVERDMRGQLSEEIAMRRIMKDNNFKENAKVKDAFIATIDSTIIEGQYKADENINTKSVLFSTKDQSWTVQDFVEFIYKNQKRQGFLTPGAYAYQLYDRYLQQEVFAYEDSKLEDKYPDFKALVQEYHDGILLFSLMENEVWNKAVEDTLGLQDYYERNKESYMWNDRVRAVVVTCQRKDNVEEIKNLLVEGIEIDSLRTYVKENKSQASVRLSFYQKGDNVNVDATQWQDGAIAVYPSAVDNTTQIVKIVEVRQPEPKTFKEARGLVTSGYQAELEKQWLEQLREKYSVTVDEKLLNKVKNNY